jgi:multidrug efflux pump subunit AcrB
VRTNALPATIDDLNNTPVKFVNGATVFIKDVGQVHDGWLVQQNVVRTEGKQSVLLSIIKNRNASTLAVVNAVKKALPIARASAPRGMQIQELFDQSLFVKDSIIGLLREGAIAAGLTALMILCSWARGARPSWSWSPFPFRSSHRSWFSIFSARRSIR